MRFFGLLLAFLFFISPCFAWEPDPVKDEINNIPEYKEYFEEYAQRLYENFQPQKHFIRGIYRGDNFYFTIKRDGTVENIDNFFYDNKFTKYCYKVIQETKADPFPEAIKDELIVVYMWLYYSDDDDSVKLSLYGRTKSFLWFYWQKLYDLSSVNLVDIHIYKDARIFRRKH